MARSRSRNQPDAGDAEPDLSWKEWSKSHDADRFDTDLSTIDSDVEDFGTSGAKGFSEAWTHGEDTELKLPEATESAKAERLRRFDRRSAPGRLLALVAGVALIGGMAYGVAEFLDRQSSTPDDATSELSLVVPPGQPRTYVDGEAGLSVPAATTLDEYFRAASPGAEPEPTTQIATLPADAEVGTVMWGGRAHVVVVGEGVGSSGSCFVATLLTDDFGVVDLAAAGACEKRYEATGDRLACAGDDVVLVEVWSANPFYAGEQPVPTQLRVRIERHELTGETFSVRNLSSLGGPIELTAGELPGRPGDRATFDVGGRIGTCELKDRSEVAVQLL